MMFEHLSNYRIVIVTGPQRSGTRICAQIIAQDTGLEYVDEGEHMTDEAIFRDLVENYDRLVIHAPTCSHIVHDYGMLDDVAVVFMRRPLDEIAASQRRIYWVNDDSEKAKYPPEYHTGMAAQTKYRFWDLVQRRLILHALDVGYHSLEQHPLWVPAEQRKTFEAGQTRVGQTAWPIR